MLLANSLVLLGCGCVLLRAVSICGKLCKLACCARSLSVKSCANLQLRVITKIKGIAVLAVRHPNPSSLRDPDP